MEHIWTMLMHKILQNHLLCAFVANLKIDAIYALYPESFCDKNLAVRKVFAFSDSECLALTNCNINFKPRNLVICSYYQLMLSPADRRKVGSQIKWEHMDKLFKFYLIYFLFW